MPQEFEYSDDVDFLDTDREGIDNLMPVANDIVNEWDLYINKAKTEFVHFRVA